MSQHAQLLKDYLCLRGIAIGVPHDSGEYYDQMADDMLASPTKKEACDHLYNLIELYFQRGGPDQECMHDDPICREIFIRHGFIDEDDDQQRSS